MEPFVDVAFPLKGKTLPLDHGYPLFGAVSRVLPAIHSEEDWGVFPVHGRRTTPGILSLVSQSLLTLRIPAGRIAEVLDVTGKTLDVAGHSIRVGIPRVFQLQPRPALQSRYVTIKKFQGELAEFAAAVRRQLTEYAASERITIAIGSRRVLQVANHTIVGFPVALDGLSPDESLRIQVQGIGGRRHMGAGLFLPMGKHG